MKFTVTSNNVESHASIFFSPQNKKHITGTLFKKKKILIYFNKLFHGPNRCSRNV